MSWTLCHPVWNTGSLFNTLQGHSEFLHACSSCCLFRLMPVLYKHTCWHPAHLSSHSIPDCRHKANRKPGAVMSCCGKLRTDTTHCFVFSLWFYSFNISMLYVWICFSILAEKLLVSALRADRFVQQAAECTGCKYDQL